MPSLDLISDAELVAASLGGDRDAFGRIVERYQRLLCSLAYSSTGQLSRSEDLAQETFVQAWRRLETLREPEKLRPWLCGILRFKASRLRRDESREPVRQAESIDSAAETISPDEPAAEIAIRKEEQAIMWSALERVPEIYREALILYYREHRSVEHVAAALELTEDAVKQRLARGRKILQEQVLSFVEGALERSTPGRVFTAGVLAALPPLIAPAKAFGLGAATAHGGMIAKTTTLAAFLASITGVVNAVLALRANLDQARTPRERRAVVKITLAFFLGSLAFLALLYALRQAAFQWWDQRAAFATTALALLGAFAIAWPLALLRVMRATRALRSEERRRHPEAFRDPIDRVDSAVGEYRSRLRLCGVPLVHVRYATPDAGAPAVFAWFAGGDRAFGLIAAWGGLAVAPISVGAVGVGLFSVGAMSVGVVSLGTVTFGGFALGCTAVAVKAFAWLFAGGWQLAASGGFAVAHTAAAGPIALARHANDEFVQALLAHPHASRDYTVLLIAMVLMSLLPVAYYARAVRRRLGAAARSARPAAGDPRH
ncbi:MAG TPA: RNA polymerase sigma factor [Opitutus sp.]|nr:RNA polymerase sigma factor [Opitutus sp.]